MKIVVSIDVGRFSVKVSRDFTVNERHAADADVKKWCGCERIVRCKFDGGVNVVEVRSEGLEVVY